MNRYAIIFKNWFGYVALVTLFCCMGYLVGQQGFRQSADDPQYQLVQDAVNAINKGADPKSLGAPVLDLAETLSPYLIIYDKAGNMVINGARLNGKPLEIPKGVLNYIQLNGVDHATWQPEPGIRQAMVGMRTTNRQVVIAGRSLRKIEEHIAILGQQMALGWAISMVAMLVVAVLQHLMVKRWALEPEKDA
jgi:hypothetical protein